MTPKQVSDFFASRRRDRKDLVLITVFRTAGSTYSKAGAHMLVDENGDFLGMLSGGCLEGDLAERSKAVLASGEPQIAEYNLSADDDLFGLGVGCEGTICVLLQPLHASADYAPYATIDTALNGNTAARIGVVVESASPQEVTPGATVVECAGERTAFGLAEPDAIDLSSTGTQNVTIAGVACELLVYELHPLPSLLVLGAGPDAEPLINFATELGWQCTIQDHRPAYIESRTLPNDVVRHCIPVAELAANIDLAPFDLVMVMSHHLISDGDYLRQLATSPVGYIGLLGPPHRRDRILATLGDDAKTLDGRLHGPAGLAIGGRGPAPIALSIIAEMQQYLSTSCN